jgi:hypothetical protein
LLGLFVFASFAHLDTTNIINRINTDEIDWRPAVLPENLAPQPFWSFAPTRHAEKNRP